MKTYLVTVNEMSVNENGKMKSKDLNTNFKEKMEQTPETKQS